MKVLVVDGSMQSILSDHGGLHCPSGKADSCSLLPILSCWFKSFLLRAEPWPLARLVLGSMPLAQLVSLAGTWLLPPRDRLPCG